MAHDDLDAAEIATILTPADAKAVARLLATPAPSSVDTHWARVSAILEANIGVSFRGATDADIAAAEKATCPWTDELRDLYRRAEPTPEQRGIALLPPGFELLSLNRLLSDHRLWIDFNANPAFGDPIDMDAEMTKPTGSPAPMMLLGRALRCIQRRHSDCRHPESPLHGWSSVPDEDASWKPPLWRSVSAMLEQLAFSRERNTTFDMRNTMVEVPTTQTIHREHSSGVGTSIVIGGTRERLRFWTPCGVRKRAMNRRYVIITIIGNKFLFRQGACASITRVQC